MRIGLLASTGGMLDAFFPEIVARWRAAGHIVKTAAGNPAQLMPGAIIGGLTRRPALSARRAQHGLAKWAQNEQLDVIVTNSATASALVRTAGVRVPVVYFCHGLHWNRLLTVQDLVWQTVEHQLLTRTAAVITINSDDETWFRMRMPDHAVLRVAAGVGLDVQAYPRTPLPAGPLSLSWIGEHSPRKRPWLAIEVARLLAQSGVEYELTMVGRGDLLGRTRERIRTLGLDHCVHAIGWGDAAEALSGSHALLHTATWEGLPRVMLEAFAAGRRTYAFDVKGVRDIPEAQLLEDKDVAALAAAIQADWESGTLRTDVTGDARFLSSEGVADRILAFLYGIVDSAALGPAAAA